MAYKKQVWNNYNDGLTEIENDNNNALATPQRMNHIETGIEQVEFSLSQQLAEKAAQDYVDNYKDATGATLSAIIENYELGGLPNPNKKTNLWIPSEAELGNLSLTTGNVIESSSVYVGLAKAVVENKPYTYSVGDFHQAVSVTCKVAYYREDNSFISGKEFSFFQPNSHITENTPTGTKTIKLSMPAGSLYSFAAVIGSDAYTSEDEGTIYDNDFWTNIPSPPLKEKSVKSLHIDDKTVDESKLSQAVIDKLYEPLSDKIPSGVVIVNMWLPEEAVKGNLSLTSGAVIASSSICVSPFKEATENTPYTYSVREIYQGSFVTCKVAYYREDNSFISGKEFIVPPNTDTTLITPEDTHYMRVCLTCSAKDTFMVAIGETPLDEVEEGATYGDDFWGIVPPPPLKERGIKSINIGLGEIQEDNLSSAIVDKLNREYDPISQRRKPNPPRLNFEVIGNTSDVPRWLSEDGAVLYTTSYFTLKQTTDEFVNLDTIKVFDEQVRGIRVLSDGELLVSTGRDETTGKKAEVWKSENYDRLNPSATTFKKVHDAIGEAADFYNDWGLDVHGEIVLLCEYGTKVGTGARRVYLSTDNAESFNLIFHVGDELAKLSLPYNADSSHSHTVAYDPWFNRIWVACGDGINTSTWYSDNLGLKWNLIAGSYGLNANQYTGIIAIEGGVVFGSDRSPNGLHISRRTKSRNDVPTIEPFEILNDLEVTSHIFQMPFRRKIGEPVYFGSSWDLRAGDGYSTVMGFTDGQGADIICEYPKMITSAQGNTGLLQVIGATAGGYVYSSFYDLETKVWSVLRADALVWK